MERNCLDYYKEGYKYIKGNELVIADKDLFRGRRSTCIKKLKVILIKKSIKRFKLAVIQKGMCVLSKRLELAVA